MVPCFTSQSVDDAHLTDNVGKLSSVSIRNILFFCVEICGSCHVGSVQRFCVLVQPSKITFLHAVTPKFESYLLVPRAENFIFRKFANILLLSQWATPIWLKLRIEKCLVSLSTDMWKLSRRLSLKNWKREKTRTERKLKENKCSPIQSIIRKHFLDDLL